MAQGTVKSLVSSLNSNSIHYLGYVKGSTESEFQSSLTTIFDSMSDRTIGIAIVQAGYSNSPTAGANAIGIFMRYSNGVYKLAIPDSLTFGYYYSSTWHWTNSPSVVNNLTSTSATDALSAAQGRALNIAIQNLIIPVVIEGKEITNGYVTITYPSGKGSSSQVFVQQQYRGSENVGYVFTVQNQPSNVIVYIRNGDGTLPATGTNVTFTAFFV